jgi:hypothetical protein
VQEECPWQLPYSASVLRRLGTCRKCKITFPVLAIGAILTYFLTVILDIAIPANFRISRSSHESAFGRQFTYHLGYESDHHGLVDHSRGPGDRPCEESSLHGCDGEKGYDHLCGESGAHRERVHDHGQSRIARMLMVGFGPTIDRCQNRELEIARREVHSPQSSRDHPYQCACYASHDRHHPHHDDSRTQRRQIYLYSVSDSMPQNHASLGGRTDGLRQCEVPGYRNEQGGHSCELIISTLIGQRVRMDRDAKRGTRCWNVRSAAVRTIRGDKCRHWIVSCATARSNEEGKGRLRAQAGRGRLRVTAESRRYKDEEGRGRTNWVIALEADHRDIEAWLTYRSNS